MTRDIKHFHLFCGFGGGARGGRHLEVHASSACGPLRARFRCLGGVDSDPAVVRAFSRYVGVQGTCLDLFSREQYRAFHGAEPPAGWREATGADLRRAAGGEFPDILVTSPPCKGFSGLVSEARSASAKYSALNALTERGIALALEAFADDPPGLWLLENVPRLATRGEHLLSAIVGHLEAAGYSCTWTVPDLGELGGLGQSRKRLHLVARHRQRVPVFVFEPPRRPLRAVGDVLGPLPLPEHPAGGMLHRLPRLTGKTWTRLALIPAGGDWRDLQKLEVVDGILRNFAIAPDTAWHTNGAHAVQDPRIPGSWGDYQQYGVIPWEEPAPCVTANGGPGGGPASIPDPRLVWDRAGGGHFAGAGHYGVQPWDRASGAVTAAGRYDNGPLEPRRSAGRHVLGWARNVYRIVRWDLPSVAITAGQTPTSGGVAIGDPRFDWHPEASSSKFRVAPWDRAARTLTGSTQIGSGAPAVADPRPPAFLTDERGLLIIRALDGTWHRPMTVLERAALQGLVSEEDIAEFCGAVEGAPATRVSEWVGNAIPPPAMEATLRAAGLAILLSRAGETFVLSNSPVWVRPFGRGVLLEGGVS